MSAPTQQDILNLKYAIDRLCNVINNTIAKDETITTLINKIPTSSITRNKSLSGSLTALTAEACISVTLRNNGNSLIYTAGGSATEQTMIANEVVTLFETNANLISVRGTGTLEYIVDKV